MLHQSYLIGSWLIINVANQLYHQSVFDMPHSCAELCTRTMKTQRKNSVTEKAYCDVRGFFQLFYVSCWFQYNELLTNRRLPSTHNDARVTSKSTIRLSSKRSQASSCLPICTKCANVRMGIVELPRAFTFKTYAHIQCHMRNLN